MTSTIVGFAASLTGAFAYEFHRNVADLSSFA
jgi:hypothetical protein